MERIYDGQVLVDWGVDPWAATCPTDSLLRQKWGWQQDHDGRWYRDLAPGQEIGQTPADFTPPSSNSPKPPKHL